MPVDRAHGLPARPLRVVSGALCALALLAAASLPAHAAATLTVIGEGSATAEPDMALVATGVVTAGKTAGEAVAANSKAAAAVIAVIKEAGIAPKDIATANFSLSPQYASGAQSGPPRLVGFEARNTVRVKVRDLAQLGALLDKMVQSGANQASGLTFLLSDPDKMEEAARVDAVKDGMAQAKSLAAAAGMRIVRISSIDMRADRSGPVMPAPMMMKAEAARAAVPIEAGELEVRAHATLVFEIEPQ
ncbi:SIMPL domain-containing protein [Xanthobacter pseudotagetidis]|uniref:SIMPL domain-containing protein n=1 Tax=Xanthobacter pseudotagetidis TaxID=3119911 RepID=UPI00372CC487